MTFLNPAILFGLLAVSIPILIHLFNLRKVQRMEFSTLMFIKELQKSKLKRIKIKQLILLALRFLAIIFLVIAFSKPVFEGIAGDGSGQKTVIIFIDDSFSMNVRDESGSYFEQAKSTVENILKNYKENDEVYFIPTSTAKMKNKRIFYEDFQEIADSLKTMTVGYKSASMDEIVLMANELLSKSKNIAREVYIISDFQRGNFTIEENAIEREPVKNTNLYLVNIGERESNNLSVDDFEVVSKIIDKDRTAKVRVNFTNHNRFNVSNKILNLYIDGNKVTERVTDAGSLSKKEVDFEFKPMKTGSIRGYIELAQNDPADDEITEDNRMYFTLYIPEEFNVLILSNTPANSGFIEAALASAEELLSDSVSSREKFVKIEQLSSPEDLNRFDLVFITGKSSFSEQEAMDLKNYVENGRGVFIFPDENIDVNNYNEVLLSKFSLARMSGIQGVSPQPDGSGLEFERLDFEHPLLAEVFKNERLSITSENTNIESPNIRNYYEIIKSEGANAIISLNNKKDFLIEANAGDGKILLSSVPANLSFSDFPLKSLFAPLIIRSVFYLGNSFDYKKNYSVGQINIINTRNLGAVKEVITPPGLTNVFENNIITADYFAFPYDDYSKFAGIYTLVDSSGNNFMFALNKKSDESILEKLSDNEAASYFEQKGYENTAVINEPSELQTRINEARFGKDISIFFLLAALACVAAEIILSKRMEES
jgi:hypothetical protein